MAISHYLNTAAVDPSRARTPSLITTTPQVFPVLFLGDNRPHQWFFHNDGTIESFSGNAAYTLRITLGDANAAPFGGTYTLTCGSTTAAIPYNATASDVQNVLNGLATIIAQGGVTVLGAFPTFLIYHNVAGVVTAITGSAILLSPNSGITTNILTTGAAGVRQETQLALRRQVIVSQTTWSDITSPYNGWSGSLTTNTEGAQALLVDEGQVIGEYIQASTLLTAEVIDNSGNPVAYYQTAVTLRVKNSDLAAIVVTPLDQAVLADSSGNLVSPLNFFTQNGVSVNPLTTLGDTLYGAAAGVETRLPGNTTATRKFLRQVGNGAVSAAPAWDTLVAGDIPDLSATYQPLNTKLTAIGALANGAGWLHNDGSGVFVYSTPTKSDVGLGNVENTALSTWAGSTNLTTLGTIGTGTWQGTAIANGFIATALTGKTYNGLTLTAAATGFTIAGGTTSKTLTMSNTLTLAGTDSSTLNIGAGGTLGTGAFQPQTVLTGTAGQITVSNSGVGATTLSIPTAMTGITSLTAPASTDLTLNAGSGNQNINLITTGTGFVSLGASNASYLYINRNSSASPVSPAPSNAQSELTMLGTDGNQVTQTLAAFGGANAVIVAYSSQGTAAVPTATTSDQNILRIQAGGFTANTGTAADYLSKGQITFQAGGLWSNTSTPVYITFHTTAVNSTSRTERARFAPSGNFLLGGLTTDGTGVLQFPAATTTAGGIAFGTDLNIFRNSGSFLEANTGFAFASTIGTNLTSRGAFGFQSGSSILYSFGANSTTAGGFTFQSLSNNASINVNIFTLATATGATFTAVARSSGVVSYFTVNAPADIGLSANTESIGVNFAAGTRTWADGTVPLQEEYFFGSNTYNKTTTSATFTLAVGASFGAPIAGASVTFTNSAAALMRGTGKLMFGATALASIAVSADTTSGIVTFLSPSSGSYSFDKKITSYNGVACTGWGAGGAIVASGSVVGAVAAGNITNGAYTLGAADAEFLVSGNINVTAAIAISTSLNVAYTDETNTARTLIMPISGLAGSFVAGGLATSTGPFESAVLHLRCKASTTITFSVAAGTFTSVTYNARCCIRQVV